MKKCAIIYNNEKLLKIKISEVRKFVRKDKNEIKEEFKLASGFKTKYPVKDNKSEKIDIIKQKRNFKIKLKNLSFFKH